MGKAKPNVLIMSGYGTNCEEETASAFERAGAKADIVHINDLIEGYKGMRGYQILAFPGGFSFGDDTGSGLAFANRVRNKLWDKVKSFVEADTLTIGICNGFQVLANAGLVTGIKGYGERDIALMHNDSARYDCRWVDLQFSEKSPWTRGIGTISLPIAHGEGKFYAAPETLAEINKRGLVAARYVPGEVCAYQQLQANPNGALEDIAGITDVSGRVLGMMPHPERAVDFTQLPNWPLLKEQYRREGREVPSEGLGMKIFRNAVKYFR